MNYHLPSLILVIITCITPVLPHDASPFIITPQEKQQKRIEERSTPALKEEMGESLESVMHACTDVQKVLGEVQVSLASLQKRFLTTTRSVIENQPPVKNASNQILAQTTTMLRQLTTDLQKQAELVGAMKRKLGGNTLMSK